MKTVRAAGLFAASLFTALFVLPSAHAALIHDLVTNFGSGQITFTNDLGGTDVNDVEAFSFDVTSGFAGGPQTYTKQDINAIDWSIGEGWGLTLNLVSDLITFGSFQSGITLVNDGVPTAEPCLGGFFSPAVATSCETFAGFLFPFVKGALLTEAVHVVSEPSTTLMFAVGLVSLIWLRRRRFSLCRRRFLGDFV